MILYWALFSIAAALAILPLMGRDTRTGPLVTAIFGFILIVFIGFRFQVGTDWLTYEFIFLEIDRVGLLQALPLADPAYSVINWAVGSLGGDIWHVNLICAAIFVYGLMRFCNILPYPGVALLAAIPYLVIVVGMGYTRQATAVGCLMAAIAGFQGRLNLRLMLWLVLALAFHKSAIILIPIFVLSSTRGQIVNIMIGVGAVALLLSVFVLETIDRFLDLYLGGEMQSGGAAVRLVLSLSTTILYFIFLNRRSILGEQQKLWRNMGYVALALIPIFLYSPSSTAVDRIAVLLFPSQVMIFGYLPVIVRRYRILKYPLISVIIAVNFAILFTWLNFSEYAKYWDPYRNVLFEPYVNVF